MERGGRQAERGKERERETERERRRGGMEREGEREREGEAGRQTERETREREGGREIPGRTTSVCVFFFPSSDHNHQVGYNFVLYAACWVCVCCHNPPNSDMDYRICIMRTDVSTYDCTQGYRHRKRVCTQS